ncbi:MAG TPA: amino acid adenylation domain-containing protein, partial [Candidatus Angelobacter sp.]|nr:amino acid adenylation domain-containing protein [Candidatus Angelobacter sp.]
RYWERAAAGAELLPGARLDGEIDCIATSGNLRLTLPVALTETLLTAVPEAFYAQINDVLLTGLALAALQWRRDRTSVTESSIVLDLEGHGREPMDSGLDLSRTVGWFTTVFPVRLDLEQIDLSEALAGGIAAGRALKLIKEQLRSIPANGLDYGLLRYSSPEISERMSVQPHPQIAFNYLGRFATQDGSDWLPVGDDAGFSGGADPAMAFMYLVEIDAIVSDAPEGPRLTANFAWSKNHLDESSVASLVAYWRHALEAIVDHTRKGLATGHSPSDFPLVKLSMDQVEQIESAFPGVSDILPLSPLQQGLLFHSLYAGAADVYTVQTNIEFTGRLDSGRLRRAIEILLERHANLRVSIHYKGTDEPLQIVPKAVALPWREVDLSALDEASREERCSEIVTAERAEPFNFSTGPLIRIALVRLAPDRHLLVFTNHHTIMDGWSTPILVGEMLTLYDNGLDPRVLPAVRPYAAHLAWLTKQDHPAGLSLWRDYLAGLESPTVLAQHSPPVDGARIPASWQLDLSPEFMESLQAKMRLHGLTLNALLQGVWAVLLARRTNQKDIVFGITVSGRSAEVAGIEEMIGIFINTVPLRVRFATGEPFITSLSNMQKRQSEMLAAYYLGLSDVQRTVDFERLFDTLFVFENYPIDPSILKRSFAGIRISKVEMRDGAHYPVSLMVAPGERLHVRLDYDPVLFSREQVEVIGGQFVRLLHSAAGRIEVPWHDLELFSEEERNQILQGFNNTSRVLPRLTAAQIFEHQVALTPNVPAVVQGDRVLTYQELNGEANRLADYLRKQGIGAESLVGIALARSPEMIVAILATWKAGGAYLPLDPEYPRARLEHMINDAQPRIVLANSASSSQFPHASPVKIVCLDSGGVKASLKDCCTEDQELFVSPDHAAYVIYTSGSTGAPKGVVVTHRGLGSLASSQIECLKLEPGCRVLQFASLNFDASFWEFLMTFSSGATLVLPSDEREGARLYELLVSQRVTHALLPIPVLRSLESFDRLPLQVLMNGGEALSADLVARWSLGLRMINAFGPTESTVCATMSKPLTGTESPTIGSPILNMRVYILDSNLEPVPLGVAGELYIAGDGLARGYLNRPALTSSRFVADPYADIAGARIYRTGDLARWREDGNLEFLGRTDEQVKVRGFRIELGEIEAVLRSQPEIADAAAVVHENQSFAKQIAAYLVPSNGSIPDSVELRQRLSERLPVYMLPAVFVAVETLPRNPNGKLNRRMLPRLAERPKNARPPQSLEELAICAMFAEVLGVDSVSAEDDFFALGGDSLGAMRLVSRVVSSLKVPLSLRDFYSASTVEALARLVQAMQFTAIRDGGPSVETELLEEEEI